MKPITFYDQMNLKTYLNVVLRRTFKSFWFVIFLWAGFNVLTEGISSVIIGDNGWPYIVGISLALVGYPLLEYYVAKRRFYGPKGASEPILWEITSEYVRRSGKVFSMQFAWEEIRKITENRKYVFLWPDRYSYYFFSKEAVRSSDLSELRRYLKGRKGLINGLFLEVRRRPNPPQKTSEA